MSSTKTFVETLQWAQRSNRNDVPETGSSLIALVAGGIIALAIIWWILITLNRPGTDEVDDELGDDSTDSNLESHPDETHVDDDAV